MGELKISNVVAMPAQTQNLSLTDFVRVKSIRASQKPGLVVAHADIEIDIALVNGVRIGPILIFGLSVIANKKGPGYWIGFPSHVIAGGKRFAIVEIEKGSFRDAICKMILDACSRQISGFNGDRASLRTEGS
jgi:hypothetical protein